MDYGISWDKFCEIQMESFHIFDEMEAALEAADSGSTTSNTMTDTANASSKTDLANNSVEETGDAGLTDAAFATKAKEDAKALHDKALVSAERVRSSVERLIQSTHSGNMAFIKTIDTNNLTLKDGIDVTNWKYPHNAERYLHPKLKKMRGVLSKNVNYLHNWDNLPDDALLTKQAAEIEEELLRTIGAAARITTTRQYMEWTKGVFRGTKVVAHIPNGEASGIRNEMMQFGKYEKEFNIDTNGIVQHMKTALSTTTTHMNNATLEKKDKQSIMKQYRNACRMISIYTSLVFFTYRLHCEYMLNRRAILQNLYQKGG